MSSWVHGILTNASGIGGRGFRDIWLGHEPAWSPAERRRALDWLQGLRPIKEHPSGGVAFGCHRFAGKMHAVTGTVHVDFAHDEHGRGGFLAHSVWMPLDEDRPAPDFTSKLLEFCCECHLKADHLGSLHNDARLDAYLEYCSRLQPTPKRPEPSRVLRVDPEACLRMLELAAARSLPNESLWEERGDLPQRPASASIVLPPRLRLAVTWSFGLDQPATAVRMRETSAQTSPPPSGSPARKVFEGMENLMNDGKHDRLTHLAEDWDLRSWKQFEQEVTP